MSEMSNYLENAIIDHFFRGETITAPATRYVALFETDPTDAATGQEITGSGYARQSASFGAGSDGVSTNNTVLTFAATGDWANATHFAIYDASSGGNMLMHSPLNTAIDITATNQSIVFQTGSITLTFT